MKEVSIIVPVYNCEKYVSRCVQSILQQSFQNFELIIVDDGTTDDSINIINNFTEDSRIKIVHKQNSGLPQARKTGVEHANGKYIVFVDADDWIENDMIEKLYNAISVSGADIVCCNIALTDESGNIIEKYERTKETLYDIPQTIKAIHDSTGVYHYMWNKMFNSKCLTSSVFPKGHFVGEDYCTIIPILSNCTRVLHIPHTLYNYVQHTTNMTKAGFSDSYILAHRNYNSAKEFLLKQYTDSRRSINNFHILQEIAILNAMFRNNVYNKEIFNDILKQIEKGWLKEKNCQPFSIMRYEILNNFSQITFLFLSL